VCDSISHGCATSHTWWYHSCTQRGLCAVVGRIDTDRGKTRSAVLAHWLCGAHRRPRKKLFKTLDAPDASTPAWADRLAASGSPGLEKNFSKTPDAPDASSPAWASRASGRRVVGSSGHLREFFPALWGVVSAASGSPGQPARKKTFQNTRRTRRLVASRYKSWT